MRDRTQEIMFEQLPDNVDIYTSQPRTNTADDQQEYSSLGYQSLQSLPYAGATHGFRSSGTAGPTNSPFVSKMNRPWPAFRSQSLGKQGKSDLQTDSDLDHSVGYHSLSYSSGGDTKLNDSIQLMSLQSGGTIALSGSNSNQYSSLVTDSSRSHTDLSGSGAIPKVRRQPANLDGQAANLDGQAANLDGQARRTNGYQPQSGRHSLQTDSAILGINLSIKGSESTGLIINGKQGNEKQSKPQITSKVKGAERTTPNQENQINNSQINNSHEPENVGVENKETPESGGSVRAPEPQTQSPNTSSSSGGKKRKNKKKNKKNTTDSNSSSDSKVNGNENVKTSKTNEKPLEVKQFIASLDSNDENNQTLEEIRAENKRLKEAKQCKICHDYDSNRMFLPCAHLAACSLCSPAVVNCPQCKAPIRGVVAVYFG